MLKDEFEHEEEKTVESVKNLTRVEVHSRLVILCFNAYALSDAFFGCRVVQFDKKIKELKQIHE